MIRLSKSVVGKAESAAVAHIIEDIGYLGMGAVVGDFEHELEQFIGGNRRVLCVNSGTAALHLAVQAVTRPGNEVLVPSPGFVIYAPHAKLAGGVPVEYRLTEGEIEAWPTSTSTLPAVTACASSRTPPTALAASTKAGA